MKPLTLEIPQILQTFVNDAHFLCGQLCPGGERLRVWGVVSLSGCHHFSDSSLSRNKVTQHVDDELGDGVETSFGNEDLQPFMERAGNLQGDVTFYWHSPARSSVTDGITSLPRRIG
jgi:hypothetical protein